MDLRLALPAAVRVLEACHIPDAADLVAVGTDDAVLVLQVSDTALAIVATFHLAARVTALAFSPRSVSPSTAAVAASTPDGGPSALIELVAATADFGLHLLTKEADAEPTIFPFGGGNTGHHGNVAALAFCGTGSSAGPADRYVASASADHMLIVWDLHPALDIPSAYASGSPDSAASSTSSQRKQPTAYPIPFPHPLIALATHPRSDKDLLVADSRGTLHLIDWRSDRAASDTIAARRAPLALLAPTALAHPDAASGGGAGSLAWARDAPDLVGASYGAHFALWDLSAVHGGTPTLSAPLGAPSSSFSHGARRMRFAPGPTPHFALAPARAPAELHIRSVAFPGAPPAVLALGARPQRVADFDFLDESPRSVPRSGKSGGAGKGAEVGSGGGGGEGAGVIGRGPRVAAGVGRSVLVFWVGEE